MNIIKAIFYLLATLLFVTFTSSAQTKAFFHKIDQTDGLSNNRINAIGQDDNQFIWIATMNGLNRYDGSKIKTYTRQNSSIISNVIFNLLIDTANQKIWLGTSKGLGAYDIAHNNFISYSANIPNDNKNIPTEVKSILKTKNGKLWLGAQNGIYIFDPIAQTFEKCPIKTQKNGIRNKKIFSLTQNSDGIIFAGSYGEGLLKYDASEKNFKPITSDTISISHIYDIQFLNANEILLATSGNGAVVYNFSENIFYKLFENISKTIKSPKIIRDINIDSNQNIWLGTDGEGLYQIQNSAAKPKIIHHEHLSQRNASLSGNAIYSIFQDQSKNYWIGTSWNGINYLSFQKEYDFYFSDFIGEKNIAVLSILKSNTILYFGLDGDGLTTFDTATKKITSYNPKTTPNFKGATIQYIYEQGNYLWLGTFADGLIRFNKTTKTTTQYKYDSNNENSISFDGIREIVEDKQGNLWIATEGGGLNFYNKTTAHFTSYKSDQNNPSSISSNNLSSVKYVNNNLWIGTSESGINIFNPKSKKTTHLQYNSNDDNSISSNNILNLYVDSHKNVWVGTADEGINRIHPNSKKVERFKKQENLKHQKITGIIEDDHGIIWFCSQNNIYNYNYNTNKFKEFPNLNGEYRRNAIYKDNNGALYFGGKNGTIKIDPNTFSYNETTPEVVITDFKLFNKEVPVDGKILSTPIHDTNHITLNHNQDVITFEFNTLNFPSSKNFEYTIQMENFDKEWRNIGHDNKITYTNLSPGNYTFKVKNRVAGTKWSNNFTAITLDIKKPFWLQWWAIILYILLVGLIFYLFRTYIISWEKMKANLVLQRLAYEKDSELSKLKLEFFTNISHEIRTPITLILSSINSLLTSDFLLKNNQHNAVNSIQKNSTYLLNLINNLLDYRKIDNNLSKLKISPSNWVEFCHEIFLSFKELANQKKIEFHFTSSNPDIPLWFDKNQMEKVIYNLLSNALKFTEKNKQIHCNIEENETGVTLTVRDQGIGISEKHLAQIFNRFYQTDKKNNKKAYAGFGLGLSISKKIINLHKGTISAESTLNIGSTFSITLPKGKSHFDQENVHFVTDKENDVTNYIATNETENISPQENYQKEFSANTTVLIVEDNNDIRTYISSLLSKYYPIIEAENGIKGLQIAQKQIPDLIISDIMMPEMDGIEMTKQIKSNLSTSHIPVLLLTARTSLIHQLEGFTTGAEDYITKPFNERLLLGKIDSILYNRQLLHKYFNKNEVNYTEELQLNEHDQKLLNKLIKLIEDNLESKDLNSKLITSELGISHSVIYKKIKSLTGLSLIEFITKIRLKTAYVLITEKDYSIIDACYKVGYTNRKYFSQQFKKHFGKNPSEYRKIRKEIIAQKKESD